MRQIINRLGLVGCGAVIALTLAGGGWLVAQSLPSGTFSKIFLGGQGANNPVIGWSATDPTGACTPGSIKLVKHTGLDEGNLWVCRKSGLWASAGANRDVYAVTDFGAVCDGGGDDTVAIQAAITAAYTYSSKAGTVLLPPGICKVSTITIGPTTDPWYTSRDNPLNLENVGFAFNAPRAATVNFTASSSTVTFVAGVITSSDVGNYVFYGTADARYLAVFGETRVLKPTYGCTITALLSSTSATCVATPYTWQQGTTLTTTTGAHAVYITDEHNFTIDNTVFNASGTAALDAGHVGKSMRFVVPIVPAYLQFDDTNRVGSHVADERATASPCTSNFETSHWQCLTDDNMKSKYFAATVTSVLSATTGTMHIDGMSGGSNWVDFFPDYPSHGAQGGVCGGPESNCAAQASHQWGHLVPADSLLIGKNPHLDHYAAPELMSDLNQFQNKHTYLGQIFPYTLPVEIDQRYITLKGASQAASTLSFTGCTDPKWATACPALVLSKNKYFHMEDFSVANASGSSTDDLSQFGIYFGGLPGVGTQTLVFKADHIGVSGFGVGLQLGDNLGGEMSDCVFDSVAASGNGIGVRVGPGSFNTLDLHFHNLLVSFNKIGLLNYEGNVFVESGGSSYNTIDFISSGFGPFTVANWRTEGPGLHLYGGEPGLIVRSVNLAEPQASRAIVGSVDAFPASVHTVTGVDIDNNDVGLPANSFYPITFAPGDFTAADMRKLIVFPGVGAGGADMAAQLWELTSATTGTVFVVKSAGVQSAGSGLSVTVYDTNLATIQFDAEQIVAGDVGMGLSLPNSSVTSLWNRAVRCIITEITSATTGTCGFYIGNQGGGPVKPGGGTDANPHLFTNTAVMLESAPTATFDSNTFATGMVSVGGTNVSGGDYTFRNNQLWSPGQWPLVPVSNRAHYALDLNPSDLDISGLPTPTSALGGNVGLELPWVFVPQASSQFEDTYALTATGNLSYLYGGPIPWPLNNGHLQGPMLVENPLQELAKDWMTYDSSLNPFAAWRFPGTGGPFGPRQRLSGTKELSESRGVGGNNLRFLCHFATADTCTGAFTRSESITADSSAFDAPTREYTLVTTSGHFTQEDVGKAFKVAGCCEGENGADYWGLITSIANATHITVRQVTNRANSFPNGSNAFTATIGEDEPDAKWIPILGGCTGIDTGTSEVIDVTSWTAAGITLTSSNATSTATCRVLIVR